MVTDKIEDRANRLPDAASKAAAKLLQEPVLRYQSAATLTNIIDRRYVDALVKESTSSQY